MTLFNFIRLSGLRHHTGEVVVVMTGIESSLSARNAGALSGTFLRLETELEQVRGTLSSTDPNDGSSYRNACTCDATTEVGMR